VPTPNLRQYLLPEAACFVRQSRHATGLPSQLGTWLGDLLLVTFALTAWNMENLLE